MLAILLAFHNDNFILCLMLYCHSLNYQSVNIDINFLCVVYTQIFIYPNIYI